MVGFDSDSQQRNNKNSFGFSKGQEVEVSSDEEGFRGAWYVATIVESSQTKSASKKRKKILVEYKTLVKEDGRSSPLSELVDLGFVRPSAPDDGNRVFHENDIVDADYRDGWWTGIVRKVLDGFRYRVYFDNPPDVIDFDGNDLRPHWDWVNGNWVLPETQRTAGSIFSSGTAVEVNVVKENAGDAWFPAVVIKENGDDTFLVKYQNSGKSNEADTKVNVDSLHIRLIPPSYEDRDFELLEKVVAFYDSALHSGLITKLLAGRRYKVHFKNSNVDKELSHSQIRPHAEWIDGQWKCAHKEVMLASDNQQLLVDINSNGIHSDMSIRPGSSGAEAASKEKPANSATIMDMLEQSNDCNENKTSNILPPSKKIKLAAPNCTGAHSFSSRKSTEEDVLDVPLYVTVETPIEAPTLNSLRRLATRTTRGKRNTRKSIVSEQISTETESTPAGKREVVLQSDSTLIRIKELPEKSRQQKAQKLDIVTMKGRHTKSPFKSPHGSASADATTGINEIGDEKHEPRVPVVIALKAEGTQLYEGEETLKLLKEQMNLNDSAGGKIKGLDQHKRKGSSQRRKRGRPCKLVTISQLGKEGHGNRDEIVLNDQPNNEVEFPIQKRAESTEKTAGVSGTDCFTKEVDMAITPVSEAVVDDDQPLSMWIGGLHSSSGAEELDAPSALSSGRLSNGWDETTGRDVTPAAMISSVNEARGNGTPDGDKCLPFVKRSLVWKTIESMEIFRTMPQKPHFRPLADCKEEYREGSAIGIMVTFASLFEKINSLRFDDSENVLASTLESLHDLEKHGFDVTMPRNRLNKLLSFKKEKNELVSKSEEVERQIGEHTDEKRKLDSDIKDIEKKIIGLQEELAASKSILETKENVIARLQLQMDSLKGSVNNARDNFEIIASAPWKLR